VKADLSDAELATLSAARVKSLQPGIEAIATSTLRLMKKGTSGLGNIRFLKDCLRRDVYPEWNLLVGFPGEDEAVYEAYERDLPLLAHLPPPSGVYPIRFDRFSPYFTHAAEYGLDLAPYDFYALVYPFAESALRDLAYYFIDRNFHADYITRTARWIGRLRARVDAWRDRWHGSRRANVPRLFLKQSPADTFVHDSRGEQPIEYALAPAAQQILDRLDAPATPGQLATATGLDAHTIERELAWLRERQLIVGEGDRVLSLVFRSEPALMECQRQTAAHADAPALVARARSDRRVRRDVLTAGQPG
jgi:magnesium-protoporphyrin IX monomethyl ester (oxidative) cyclase